MNFRQYSYFNWRYCTRSSILVLIYYWFWLGLTDLQSEGNYVWSHSSKALNGSGNWLPGEPDNANTNQHCVYMRHQDGRFQWGDIECTTDFIEFICQSSVVWMQFSTFKTMIYIYLYSHRDIKILKFCWGFFQNWLKCHSTYGTFIMCVQNCKNGTMYKISLQW